MFGDRDLTGALGENSNILRRISRLSTVSVVRVKRDGRSMRVLTTSDGVPFYAMYISRACPKRNRVPAGIQSYSGLLCDSKPAETLRIHSKEVRDGGYLCCSKVKVSLGHGELWGMKIHKIQRSISRS